MDLGGFVLLLLMTPVLAAIGITTLAAFAIMTLLGLLSDMSFKRLFFVSFFMGLAAPVMLSIMVFSSFADGTFERDLRDGIEQFVDLPPDDGGNLGGALGELQRIGREVDRGNLSEDEAEAQIRELFIGSPEGSPEGSTTQGEETLQIGEDKQDEAGLRIDLDGVEISGEGEGLTISID
jgi:hypothetical protein